MNLKKQNTVVICSMKKETTKKHTTNMTDLLQSEHKQLQAINVSVNKLIRFVATVVCVVSLNTYRSSKKVNNENKK